MSAEIKGVTNLVNQFRSEKDELSRDYIDLWFAESQDHLYEAAGNRSGIDSTRDSRGSLEGRQSNGLSSIAQSAVPPSWDDDREAWVFSYTHEGAVYQEYGTRPHEIRAKQAEFLAFEWPDAPQEVQKMFEDTEGDLVFFKSIQHPGIPAIGFVRYGRERARQKAQQAGINMEEFER